MTASYHLVIKSAAGIARSHLVGNDAIKGFRSLAVVMHINAAGMVEFTLGPTSPVLADLETDGQVEVWRNNVFLVRALYQDIVYTVDDRDSEACRIVCRGENDFLARAIVAWKANTINRTIFTGMRAESIAKTLVRYNLTSDASIENGREMSNPTTCVSIELDRGRGESLTPTDMMGKNLLTQLQEVAQVGGIDFDLVKVGDASWEFRVYEGQRGEDRTSTVVFTRDRTNAGALTYTDAISDVKTVALLGGAGEEQEREFAVRYGPDYSPAFHREVFVTPSTTPTTSSIELLKSEGDKELEKLRYRQRLDFTPLQAEGTRFGTDYFLGDLVRGQYRGVTTTYQVTGVSIGVRAGQPEDIAVELEQWT